MAGQRLSVRDIELLAHAYFRGPASLREAIEGGKLGWSLDQLKRVPEDREGCNAFERGLLRDLELLRKSIERVMAKCHDPRLDEPGLLRPGQPALRGSVEHVGTFLRKDEGVS